MFNTREHSWYQKMSTDTFSNIIHIDILVFLTTKALLVVKNLTNNKEQLTFE